MKTLLRLFSVFAILQLNAFAGHQPKAGSPVNLPTIPPEAEWFYQAKLGIFLHWGIYAVDETVESHPFNQPPAAFKTNPNCVPYDAYFAQLKGFNAANYDPAHWAEVFHKGGAKYAIITTKHHDGFALFDSKAPGALTAVKDSPAARDLIKPWVEAMCTNGVRPGFYFSLADWHHPDYPSMLPREDRQGKGDHKSSPYSYAEKDDPARWARFMDYAQRQLDELIPHNPDIWWFDGGWERTADEWQGDTVVKKLLARNPNVIIGRNPFPGVPVTTYETPERAVPVRTPGGLWELCLTTNEHWSYRSKDLDWKSAGVLVQIFSEVIGRGGNLLLNIGPKADGTLPVEATGPLLEMGEWIQRNQEAVYPTFGGEQAGISFARFNGPSTVSRDGKTLYLFVHAFPQDGILLRGIVSVPTKISVLATGEKPVWRQMDGNAQYPGHFHIKRPQQIDPLSTVLKLEFPEVIQIEGTAPKAQEVLSRLAPPAAAKPAAPAAKPAAPMVPPEAAALESPSVCEPFATDAYASEMLNYSEPKNPGFSGPWFYTGDHEPERPARIVPGNLSVPGSGGYARLETPAEQGAFNSINRALALQQGSPLAAFSSNGSAVDRGAIYLGFAVRTSWSGGTHQAVLVLNQGPGNSEEPYLAIGSINDDGYGAQFWSNSSAIAKARAAKKSTAARFMVVRIDFTAGKLSCWVDPSAATEPAPDAVMDLPDGFSFSNLALRNHAAPLPEDTAAEFDEIRFGPSFASVLAR
jgi:alpha-L-fucosidase